MKPLKPSMREKKRYLFVSGKLEDLEKAILGGIGILGMSKVGLGFVKEREGIFNKKNNENKKKVIISVNRDSVNQIRACFAIWPEKIIVEGVSGTIKGLKKRL